MTSVGDIVLIFVEDKPMGFARIEDIRDDAKKDWFHIKLLMLQVPLQVVTWILRDVYIDGSEFTMNGIRMRMEKVICPPDPDESDEKEGAPKKKTPPDDTGGNVIAFKKKNS